MAISIVGELEEVEVESNDGVVQIALSSVQLGLFGMGGWTIKDGACRLVNIPVGKDFEVQIGVGIPSKGKNFELLR